MPSIPLSPHILAGSTSQASNDVSTSKTFYLLKAEPDSRIEKGKDVKVR